MNNLDFMPQKLARRADTQTAKLAPNSQEGQDANGAGNGEDFSSLLKDLGAKEAASARTGTRDGDKLARMPAAASAETADAEGGEGGDALSFGLEIDGDRSVKELLQAMNGDGPTANMGSPAQPQGASAVFSLLEGLLPRVLGQNGQRSDSQGTDNGGARGTGLPSSDMADLTGETLLNTPSASPVSVSVQRQETHFKPVVEGFTTKIVGQDQASNEGEAAGPDDLMAGIGLKDPSKKPAADVSATIGGLTQAGAPKPAPEKPLDLVALKMPTADRAAAKAELGAAGVESGPKADQPTALPAGTLNRIAGAIMAEASQMVANARATTSPAEAALFVTSAKASENAVRMLNIQLHPADLGLITVKMKLTGDNLEMELQVSNEETARLLKSDTDKLSNLLKGSGYRPDVITVQTAASDAPSQDGTNVARQQSSSPSQQEAFQRGAQQQNSGSQQRDREYQHERNGGRDDASSEGSNNSRSAGGIYL